MAEEENNNVETIEHVFPTGRVKRIMKLDKDINKVNSEALFIVARSVELFLSFLAERSATVAIEKKRKIVNLDHIRIAVKRHQPASDFLLDSLPEPSGSSAVDWNRSRVAPAKSKPVPVGTRPIDSFFEKSVNDGPNQINDS